MNKYYGLAFVCVLSGCSMNKPISRINDVAVPKGIDSGYRVIAVDGGAAVRASGEDATVVPFVELPPGPHTFKIQREGEEPLEISSTLEPDKRYRIATKKGTPFIMEDLR
jgi:hypothetical protein